MTPPKLTMAEIDELERKAKAACSHKVHSLKAGDDYRAYVKALDYNTVLSLLAAARELEHLKSALEFLLVRDNWYLKNTCGISYPAETVQNILALARERGWQSKPESESNGG